MSRAIQFSRLHANRMFFQQQDNLYRYYYRRSIYEGARLIKAGRLKLQVTKARMEAFRGAGTMQTKAALDVVSILSQGGGWYTIESEDLSRMDAAFNTVHDGLRMFLSVWNAFWNRDVQQAGRPRIWREEPRSVPAMPTTLASRNCQSHVSPARLAQLAQHFSRSTRQCP